VGRSVVDGRQRRRGGRKRRVDTGAGGGGRGKREVACGLVKKKRWEKLVSGKI